MPTSSRYRQQQGVTLAIVLIVLAGITLLGFSLVRDASLQRLITRNTQFTLAAHSVAFSEINARLGDINNNAPGATDATIQALLTAGEGGRITLLDTINTPATASGTAIRQQLWMQLDCADCPPPPGFSDNGAGVTAIRATIQSRADLNNSSSNPSSSTQQQGFWYLLPAVGSPAALPGGLETGRAYRSYWREVKTDAG